MTCERCVAVWDNGRRDSMKKEYLVHEKLCDWGGGIWRSESTKMIIFGESINHNQDYGLPSIFRDPLNEIHWNICPNPYRGGKGFDQSGKECHFTLLDGRYHIRPPYIEFPISFISFIIPAHTFWGTQNTLPMEKHGVHRRHPVEDLCYGEAP